MWKSQTKPIEFQNLKYVIISIEIKIWKKLLIATHHLMQFYLVYKNNIESLLFIYKHGKQKVMIKIL